MNGFHGEGMTQDELDAVLGAKISQPVPAEDAFDGHDQVQAIRLDGFQERFWTSAQVAVQKTSPSGSRIQTYIQRACRSMPQ
jgi:hypothetical protein